MQGGRGNRGNFFGGFDDAFAGFGSFGGHRSLFSSVFGGGDPFDDPFFTEPFGSMFGPTRSPFSQVPASGFLEHQVPRSNNSRGPVIEEINSDDEKQAEQNEEMDNPRKYRRPNKEPYVEDPEDETEEMKSKGLQYYNPYNIAGGVRSQPQTRSFTYQSSSVTYGGSNGACYTKSTSRRTGSDGLTIEESKEADTSSGQAKHRISRGIKDKGHSLSRKLNPDGRVDTMQTLHNLNEDELTGFEDAWNVNASKSLPGWSERFNMLQSSGDSSGAQGAQAGGRRGWALPSTERPSLHASQRTHPAAGVEAADPSRAARTQFQQPGRTDADNRRRKTSSGRQ